MGEKGGCQEAKRVGLRQGETRAEGKGGHEESRERLKVKQSGWGMFKENSKVRGAVFLGILLQVMQQVTGMNVIMYYDLKNLQLAGYTDTTEQMSGTVLVGLHAGGGTFPAIGPVRRRGR